MNKLRAVSWGGGGFIMLLSLWAGVYYAGSTRLIFACVIGVVAAGLPYGLMRLKQWVRSFRLRLADDERFGTAKGSIFVSESTVDDSLNCLEEIRATASTDDNYDEVRPDAFDEGPGLTVLHAGFHNSFVRITSRGRVVVTGASERTQDLAALVADTYSLSFERTRNNPFEGVEPIKGAPRVFLGVIVVVTVLVGVHAVTATAYPSGIYNPAERTVLVGIDGQASLDPGVSETEATLKKAAFLVTMIEESPTEIRWASNDTDRITAFGRQAVATSNKARSMLASVDDQPLTTAQAERVDELEHRLGAAERDSAAALDARANSSALNDTTSLYNLSDRLQAAGNQPAQSLNPRAVSQSYARRPISLSST